MVKSCIFAGSFDPITNGHIMLIKEACLMFDVVYVAVLNNIAKKYMFSTEKRVEMAKSATANIKNASVVSTDGLLTDLMKELEVGVIVKGVRNTNDFILEQQMAFVNKKLLPNANTILLMANDDMQNVSSTVVRELIIYGADYSDYVPSGVLKIIQKGNTE